MMQYQQGIMAFQAPFQSGRHLDDRDDNDNGTGLLEGVRFIAVGLRHFKDDFRLLDIIKHSTTPIPVT